MSTDLRIFVYIRLIRSPPVVEIEFPDTGTGRELARLYQKSIADVKSALIRGNGRIVSFELPPSITDISTNMHLNSLVLHFDNPIIADRFKDGICKGVAGSKRQVFIKQYWDRQEVLELEEMLWLSEREREPRVMTLPERAPAPPTGGAGYEGYAFSSIQPVPVQQGISTLPERAALPPTGRAGHRDYSIW